MNPNYALIYVKLISFGPGGFFLEGLSPKCPKPIVWPYFELVSKQANTKLFGSKVSALL